MEKNDQAEYVWKHGTILANRETNDLVVNLYDMGSFFVEIFYNKELNYIHKIKANQSFNCTLPYIKLMDLSLN